jgi:hypothetical protein
MPLGYNSGDYVVPRTYESLGFKQGDEFIIYDGDDRALRNNPYIHTVSYPQAHISGHYIVPLEVYQQQVESRLIKHPFAEYIKNSPNPSILPAHNISSRLVNFLETYTKHSKFGVDLGYFFPNVDREHTDFVYLWLDYKGREKGREGRVKMKPGKAFRKIFPFLSDVELEKLVDKFKLEFSPTTVTIHETKDADEIVEVYTMERSPDRNFQTTSYHKRLSDSCMRHDTEYFGFDKHPAYAFGSGDFTVFYALDGQGKCAGRVTVYTNCSEPQSGPIYATCEAAIEALEGKLEEVGATKAGNGDWDGASILKLKDRGKFYGPYLDCGGTLTEDSNYLIIDSSGTIEHNHCGHYSSGNYCQWCEERVDGEVTYVESVDREVCECCLEHDFFEEYWADDSVVELANGDYVAKKYIGECYEYCTIDGKVYDKDDMTEVDGKWYYIDNLEEQQREEEEEAA